MKTYLLGMKIPAVFSRFTLQPLPPTLCVIGHRPIASILSRVFFEGVIGGRGRQYSPLIVIVTPFALSTPVCIETVVAYLGSFQLELFVRYKSLWLLRSHFVQAFLETNIYLLGLTFVISIVHSVFEFLAFKNDIQFWNNRWAHYLSRRWFLLKDRDIRMG